MRKAQKRQIEETIRQMEEAHNEIKKCIEQGNAAQAEGLLADCQNAAIAIGTLIEDTEGEGHPVVTALEEYCELVYQIHENLASDCSANANKIYKSLRQKLIKAENSIRNDIKIRTAAVFLPYKASMWDSLESVWKAADADPDCDAHVIPIPYFDKNPDGSFKEEHYEGDQYPDYVTVTRYDAYDLETEHPDVIYIHNPYDECNYVTSVHPCFYAKNLRDYTDKLVYIPYFILGEIEPDNQAAIDGMKHFCFLPGTIYAHQVIVQSENMRQIYMNEYIKAAKEAGFGGEHVDRKLLEKKFLGTGSPKIDKVLNTKKEDLEIPQEWLKIIEKPDGSWKKIVFYNTSVGALLQHSEKMLQKMESVFEIFKEHKDEVALLWRPHPLIQATIESMRPQLWEEYQKLKDRYIEEGWGIYDDSSDVDRAVVLSDAYYGDGSSVVQLCRKKGMPVMVQEVEKTEYNDNSDILGISVMDAIVDNDKIWFFPYEFNSLFTVNLKNEKCELIGLISNEAYGKKRLYESMKLLNGKIYFIPFYAKSIAVYDIKKGKFNNIILDERKIGCRIEQPLFGGAEVYGKYLYIFPIFSKAIIQLNTDNDGVEYIVDWAEEVDRIRFNNDAYFKRQAVIVEDKLMIPFCNANAVMSFDCQTAEYKIYKLGEEKKGYSGITFDGESFWLSSRNGRELVRCILGANDIETMKLGREDEPQNLYTYVGVLCNQQKIMIFPAAEQEDFEVEDKQVVLQEGVYTFAEEDDQNLLCFRKDMGRLILINKKDNLRTEIEIKINDEDIDKKRMIKEAQEAMSEDKILHLEDLITVLREG